MDPLVVVVGGALLALLLVLSLRPLPGLRDAAVFVEAARAGRSAGEVQAGGTGKFLAAAGREEDTQD